MIKAEQETTIRWDLEERVVHLWSAQETVWRKMARLGVKESRAASTQGGKVVGRFYAIPLATFRWGLKRQRAAGPARPPSRGQLDARFRPGTSGTS